MSLQICIRPTCGALLLATMESARIFPFNWDDLNDRIRGRVWDASFDCSAISFSRYADFDGNWERTFFFFADRDISVHCAGSVKGACLVRGEADP